MAWSITIYAFYEKKLISMKNAGIVMERQALTWFRGWLGSGMAGSAAGSGGCRLPCYQFPNNFLKKVPAWENPLLILIFALLIMCSLCTYNGLIMCL